MQDQAQKLRKMIEDAKKERGREEELGIGVASHAPKKPDSRIIAISSGKGGVGKTSIAINLSIALAKRDRQVYIIDADLGLANVDVLLGLIPKYTLYHLLNEEKSVDEILLQGPSGIKIISGGSGIRELANLSSEKLESLIQSFSLLNQRADYIFIDTGAGISDSVLRFIEAANDLIIVVSPDPASITDAYALLKNVGRHRSEISVIVNSARTKKEAKEVFDRLRIVCEKFLNQEIKYMGYILEDDDVRTASREQKPYYLAYPSSAASACIDLIAASLEKIEGAEKMERRTKRFRAFINKLLYKE